MRIKSRIGTRQGFTLMEVLIALAIAGISLAMLTAEIGTGLTNAKLSGTIYRSRKAGTVTVGINRCSRKPQCRRDRW